MCRTFLNFFPNSFIILYVNDPITLSIKNNFKKINYIYVKNQIANGGLTCTWNQYIDLCTEHNYDVIIIIFREIFLKIIIYIFHNNN